MFVQRIDKLENFDGPLTPLSDASPSRKDSSITQTGNTHDSPPFFEDESHSSRSLSGLAAAPTVRDPNAAPYSACDLCYLQQRKCAEHKRYYTNQPAACSRCTQRGVRCTFMRETIPSLPNLRGCRVGRRRRDILRKMLEEEGILSKHPRTRNRTKAGYSNKSVRTLPRISELDVPVETIALRNYWYSAEEDSAAQILEGLWCAG